MGRATARQAYVYWLGVAKWLVVVVLTSSVIITKADVISVTIVSGN